MIGNLISRCRRGTAVGWTVLLLAGSLTAQDEASTPAEVWERIKGTEDPGVFEAYIDRYQNVSEAEIYVELAKFELEALPPAEWSNSLGMEFVRVPAGEFRMGSESGFADDDEKPVTRVKISRAFYLGEYEVTQGQWETVMGSNPSDFKNCGRDCPVESVSWDDVQQFVRELNGMEVGARYRLPTEAEWEYAARAGTRTDTPAGDLDLVGTSNAPMLDRIAWYGGNSGVRYDGGVDCSDWNEKQYPSTWCGTHWRRQCHRSQGPCDGLPSGPSGGRLEPRRSRLPVGVSRRRHPRQSLPLPGFPPPEGRMIRPCHAAISR